MKPKPLGKGLQALFEESSLSDYVESGKKFFEIPVENVRPNPLQPREQFDPKQFNALKESIRRQGLIQPIAVRQIGDQFEIVAGERRWKAVKELELDSIPAYVLEIENERHLLEVSMLENIHRSNLNPIEIAQGYQRLTAEFNLTQQQISDAFSVDRSTVTNMIRLLKLPMEIQDSLKNGEISTGHARALLALPKPADQKKLWKQIVKENLSVRQVEALLKPAEKKAPQPGKKAAEKKSPAIIQLEDKLRYTLGSQVRIKDSKNGGRIEIDYHSIEDLERLMELFAIIENKY